MKNLTTVITPLSSYPINVMRNAARRGAGTKLHIVADSENIFSKNFAIKVRNLTRKMFNELNDTVLVFRANYFHAHTYGRGHLIPGVVNWMGYGLSHRELKIEPLEYTIGSWEPQFIMRSTDPYHFEDVVTRHYDHQVLVNELCRAGYKFKLLSHVYNVHAGIKKALSDMEKLLKRVRIPLIIPFSKKFTKFLNEKYPKTKGTCPVFPFAGMEMSN